MRSANALQVQGRQAGLGHRVDDVRCGGGDERNALTRQPLPGRSGHVTDLQLLTAVPSLSVHGQKRNFVTGPKTTRNSSV